MSREPWTTDDPLAERTGETIRALLEHHGVTQTAMARLLHISNQSMGSLVRGKSLPSFVTALKLSVVFGISTQNLLNKRRALAETSMTDSTREQLRVLQRPGYLALGDVLQEVIDPEDTR
jgi:plasmid maintenance system antidote protein VapI